MSAALSYKNNKVQHLRRLLGRRSARYAEGQFVVEGRTLIDEAVGAGWVPLSEYHTATAAPLCHGRCEAFPLADGVIDRVASTSSAQDHLAIFEMRATAIALDDMNRVMVTDQINDPGNLGTILRSSEAAGFDAVVTTPGSTDPFGPKVIRASAGAIFHVPVIDADLQRVIDAGLRLVGTSSHADTDYRRFRWPERTAIVMGSEAHGLPESAPVHEWVTIPHHGRSESLNVAMAATLLAFASTDPDRGS